MIYLDVDDLTYIADRILPTVEFRDIGLLESAAARPQASAHGRDAYPGFHDKTAALLQSIAKNRALLDGNKRLALAAVVAFNGINGHRLNMSNDQAYDLVMSVAAGELDYVGDIAARLGP